MGGCVICHSPRGRGTHRRVPAPKDRLAVLAASRGSIECLPAPRHRGWPAATPTPCSISRRSGAGSSRRAPIWLHCSRQWRRATIWPDCCAARSSAARIRRVLRMLWPSGSAPRLIVRNFLGVLARQRRLAALPAIIDEFSRLLAAHRGEETAEVTSAVPLDEAQLGDVRDAVAAMSGGRCSSPPRSTRRCWAGWSCASGRAWSTHRSRPNCTISSSP